MFGIKLDAPAQALLNEVERGFGKPIREQRLPPTDALLGASRVENDGTPVVVVNANHLNEDVIIHELYHLKLKLEGYPVLGWVYPHTLDSRENRATTELLSLRVYDPILHFIFHDASIKQGIDPAKSYKEQVIQLLHGGSIEAASHTQGNRIVALNFFQALIEFENVDVIKKIEGVVNRAGKTSAVMLGRKIFELVKQANPSSPKEAIKTLVACLNSLYEGQLTFREIEPWTSIRKGSFNEMVASIEIKPAR